MSTLVIKSAIVNFSRLTTPTNNGYGAEVSAFFSNISTDDQIKLAQYGITPTEAAIAGGESISGFNFRRYSNTQRGVQKRPLVILDADKNPLSAMVGSGSVVDLKLEIYPSSYSESGYGHQLNAILVKELVTVNEIVSQAPELFHNEDF